MSKAAERRRDTRISPKAAPVFPTVVSDRKKRFERRTRRESRQDPPAEMPIVFPGNGAAVRRVPAMGVKKVSIEMLCAAREV